MKSYEDLAAFQRAMELLVEVYSVSHTFPKHELYGFSSQMRRAALGVVSQIAEGQGRLTFGEWRQLLSDARGSLFEVEAQTIAGHKLGYISEPVYALLRARIAGVAKPLSGLIGWVQRREAAAKRKKTSKLDQDGRQPSTVNCQLSTVNPT